MLESKYQYKRYKYRNPVTNEVVYSANNGDAVSRALFGLKKATLIQVAHDNGLARLVQRHGSKSDGHFRLIIGQALRQLVLKRRPVDILGIWVRDIEDNVPLPAPWVEESIRHRKQSNNIDVTPR